MMKPVSWIGKEAFRNGDEQIAGERDRQAEDAKRDTVMAQRHVEAPPVAVQHQVEDALGGEKEPAVAGFLLVLEETARP